MKNVIKIILFLYLSQYYSYSTLIYRKIEGRGASAYLHPSSSSLFAGRKKPGIWKEKTLERSIIYKRYENDTSLKGLNPKNVELHPKVLGNVEKKITPEQEENLVNKGFIDGDRNTWRNWHVMTQGQWEDIGSPVLPQSDSNISITEPYALRKPLKYWGFMRGVDSNIKSYPRYWEYYNEIYGKIDVGKYGGNHPLFTHTLFQPRWTIERDKGGLGYDDVRSFEGWIGMSPETATRVKTASDIIKIPDTGRLYQKFYLGPYPVTMGWTIGSLLKVITQSRCPGHSIVAIKIHNMNEDTTVPGVADDLLNIALNLKGVALETIEPGKEARIRTKVKGPSLLCAGGLQWPSFVRLASPETYITKIEEGAELDIELKIEWGRGLWMADNKGLLKHEEGSDSLCLKRRNIKEVDEEGFYPNSAVFGGCRMIRLAVHKLMGKRWCLKTHTCPDPMDQLVVEIWTDVSTTPKAVLEFGLMETIAWLVEMKRQISQDTNFDREDEELKDIWEKIDKYDSIKYRQKLMGGPPVVSLHEANIIPGLKESDCDYLEDQEPHKPPHAPFALPKIPPQPPDQDTLEWLARELQDEEYTDPTQINAKNFEKFISEYGDTFENKDINVIPVDKEVIESLRMCGLNRVGEIMNLTYHELSNFPGLNMDIAKQIKEYLDKNK
ncbi:DNA-directed RNA polymerase, subunit alpha, putative [Theileria equi strain WA]|uniref:DNA-directed RNA polymerase, subunit alpha, putative n=1 Tax=Theileria equi strain WA TaxID=1537102 RepID=L0AZS1_THEEQ|nr:DNA-directed RNA polymerase, subunit alpha, putative [Theileria equi strain WA]AFZ80496.1 DNA-directed RNA polymerase, subunit alpha, putative [Theileria equi strain WA]|eukprot:XP_004830162.1 DNA-directed RNA polymerase, subunit alpha, putative [Theileria equi strain WA]